MNKLSDKQSIELLKELSDNWGDIQDLMYTYQSIAKDHTLSDYILNITDLLDSKVFKYELARSTINAKKKCNSAIDDILRKYMGYDDMIVYIIRCANTSFYKIGVTQGPVQSRIKSMQCGCPHIIERFFECVCVNARSIENKIHSNYRHRQMQGEWFNLEYTELDKIISDIKQHELLTNPPT